jgi:hypothetical protein
VPERDTAGTGDTFNPYAPPKSIVVDAQAAGTGVFREGDLVRMHAAGALPDRCIRCNRPAGGYRVGRAMYWRPVGWRWVLWGALPLLFLLSGINPVVLMFFWVLVIVLAMGDYFIRRKFVVAYGLCENHRRWRTAARISFVVSWVLLVGLLAPATHGFHAVMYWWFWVLALAVLALAIVASVLYRIRLARITDDQIWLRGAGRPFCEGLPLATR